MDERDSKVEEREEERGGALIFLKKEFRDERGGGGSLEGGRVQCAVRQEAQPARKGGGKGRDEISEKAKKEEEAKGEERGNRREGVGDLFFFFLFSPSPPSLAPSPSIAVPFSVDAAALKPSFLPRPLGNGRGGTRKVGDPRNRQENQRFARTPTKGRFF